MPATAFAIAITGDRYRLVHQASGVAFDGMQLALQVDGAELLPAYDPAQPLEDGGLQARGSCGGLEVRTTIRPAGADAVEVAHAIRNTSQRPARIQAITTRLAPGGRIAMGTPDHYQLLHCHTDNVRTERCDAGMPHCQGEFPYARPLPTEPREYGRGEDQAFPGLYVSSRGWPVAFAIAATGQRLTRQVFRIARATTVQPTLLAICEIRHDLVQNPSFLLPPGAVLELDGTWFQAMQGVAPQDAWRGYLAWIGARHRFRGPDSPLLREAVYCTWNYGRFADQREEGLITTAAAVARDLPGIRWYLMDAGYFDKPGGQGETTYASCGFQRFLADDVDAQVDPGKFPHGVRHYVDRVRALGLRPGLWITPAVDPEAEIFRRHPGWLLRDRSGAIHRIGGPAGRQSYLDWTNPEVVAAARSGLRHLAQAWGIEGIKLDFWSHNFEDRGIAVGDPAATGFAARRALFGLLREALPADGIIYTCCATGMGDPFIGEFADGYRNTIDIGAGAWHEQVDNCAWALPTLLNPGRAALLLNNDSVGIDPRLPDNENLFRLAWCWITMGMQEVGGFIERLDPCWLARLRKFTDRCDRGHAVRLGDERVLTGLPLPDALFVDYPEGGPTRRLGIRQSLALFNWDDQPRVVAVRRAALGHAGAVEAEDFWSGEHRRLDGGFHIEELPPRTARLYDLRW